MLATLKRFEEALVLCEQAIQLAPHDKAGYIEKAKILADQERYEDALAVAHQVVRLDAKDAFAHHRVGDMLQKLERYEAAIKAYTRAMRLDPDLVGAYTHEMRNEMYTRDSGQR